MQTKARPIASSFLRINIGNRDDTFFWWDPWTPFGRLIHFLGQEGPSLLGIPLFSLVSQLTFHGGWALPNAKSEKQVQLQAFITTINLAPLCDKPVWLIGDKVQKSFSSKKVWSELREFRQTVPWFSLVWHKTRIPKHAFTVWLFVLN